MFVIGQPGCGKTTYISHSDLSRYTIINEVVVTGNLASLLSTRERYEKQILESKNAKLSNIEAHNKCYDLLPEFISGAVTLGAKVEYVVAEENGFQTIPAGDDYLVLLQTLRDESNERATLQYDARMNAIKRSMIDRNAPKEEWSELQKVENLYSEMHYANTNEKIHKR